MKRKYTPETVNKFFEKYSIIRKFLSDKDIISLYTDFELNKGENYHDFLWLLFNKSLIANADRMNSDCDGYTFYQNQSILFLNMANFRREEGAKTQTINKLIRQAFESQIEECKHSSLFDSLHLEVNVIGFNKGRCSYANNEHLKKYDIDEFLNKCFIASDVCTNKYGCSCSISATVKKDSKGKIMKKVNEKISTKKLKEKKGCFSIVTFLFSFTILLLYFFYFKIN